MKKLFPVIAGYIIIYAAFEILSRIMINNIILIHAVVLTLAIFILVFLVEKIIFKVPAGLITEKSGLIMPHVRSLSAAFLITIVLFIFYPVISMITGYEFVFSENWISLQIGVLLVHGFAEELMYRGFLFRHLREYFSFWRACFVSIIFFAIAHIPIISSLGIVVGGVAFLLAVVSSFPFAYLFERSGNSIIPPAIVHFAIDTIIPLLAAGKPGDESLMTSVYWMTVCMIVPYLAFVLLKGFGNRDTSLNPC